LHSEQSEESASSFAFVGSPFVILRACNFICHSERSEEPPHLAFAFVCVTPVILSSGTRFQRVADEMTLGGGAYSFY
jgi:hypothetical protein